MPDLSRLLNPRSIAVIGGSPAARVVEQCQKLGYTGKIWPVHPTKKEMHGVPCFPSLADLPGVPDAAFVAVNRHLTLDAISQLSAMGAGGAVCYASGFAESGDVELQDELVRRAGELPILGPNCYGYINALDGIALWPDEHGCLPVKHGVGVISQSGNVGINLTMQQRGLNMAYMVTVGNQAGGGVEDALQSFIDDNRVTAIGMFIEAVREPIRFAQLAQLAYNKGKRIVALQTGKSEAGALSVRFLQQSKARADRIAGVNRLKDIGLAYRTHVFEFEGLISNLNTLTGQPVVIFGTDLMDTSPNPIVAVALGGPDLKNPTVLFGDGSVLPMSEAQFRQSLSRASPSYRANWEHFQQLGLFGRKDQMTDPRTGKPYLFFLAISGTNSSPDEMLAVSPPDPDSQVRSVLLGDGSVQPMSEEDFRALLFNMFGTKLR